ncbi:GGDEF domain-containing phosphodiesterase [Ruminococcus sp.]|uniref:GGDEF domain-containing phosphodiesterase n=1 Tax=Ruminococcus sp. TaxID=41978 RepID=UPI002584434E|nr:GGDEF domain-containing phosphodiesterase [Ruminococcus sp.]MCR5020197.1 GGDEF domain-containing phosphodiesterase [Ruminococcus sp.]
MEKYCFSDNERAMMESSDIPFAIYQFINKRVVTLILSKGFCDLFGYDDLSKAYYDMDNDMHKATHPDDAARIADAALRFANEEDEYNVIYRTKTKYSSDYSIIHAQGKHTVTKTGVRLAQVWYTYEGGSSSDKNGTDPLRNSMHIALYEERMLKASYYDHLTGLPGMTYFFELATYKKQVIISEGGTPALLYMDFSGMKYFNHKFGFAEGDKLLQAFSRILAKYFGNENASRLGQDHFAVITNAEDAETQLRGVFEDSAVMNNGKTLPIHVGIYKYWQDSIVASMACDRAKFACDTLKNHYSSEFSYYNMKMKDEEDKQQYIIANLDKAIKEKWITVYYQPIVRAVNGKVCDEEALARWIDPVKGFMSPADFISVLEDHKLIYKLDLYMVDCVLQKIKTLSDAGLTIMPQSINLSRSDFDCCDIVSEICRRTDKAGISRSMINIEITESIIGEDFEFMKNQIERFKKEGFAVWMDDFGSGYSSLDLLQSIKFDLLKFDMRFMQQFDSSPKTRIILTELLRMANSLELDTVCEGVETEDQVKFLQEAGCAKLQGYFYQKPIPVEKIIEKYEKGIQIGFESPEQSYYYEEIGRVSLHDLSTVAQGNTGGFDKYFDTLPMSIIEINDNSVRFVRTNSSYRDFMQRYFGMAVTPQMYFFKDNDIIEKSDFMKNLTKCRNSDEILFLEEQIGSLSIRSCMRKIAVNTDGTAAIAVASLSINDSSSISYVNITKALAADYISLYYVDLENDSYTEYTSKMGEDDISVRSHGKDFFNTSLEKARKVIYSEDIDMFINTFSKEHIISSLDEQGNFKITYRLMVNNEPVYMDMKAMRMGHDPSHIIIGVSNVDQQMKEKLMLEQIHRNEKLYTLVMAISGDYICLYTIDPMTENYTEYKASNIYKSYGFAIKGTDFFRSGRDNCHKAIYSKEDCERFRSQFTKENVMDAIERDGSFTINYALKTDNGPLPVTARIAMIHDDDGDKLVLGVKRNAAEK